MDLFGAWVFYEAHGGGMDRHLNLCYVADLMVDILAPGDDPNTVLARYVQRYGRGWQSLEYKVVDGEAVKRALVDQGIRVTGPDHVTHPRDTGGLLLNFVAGHMPNDPQDYKKEWNRRWNEGHPSTLKELSAFTFVLQKLDIGRDLLTEVFGGEILLSEFRTEPEPMRICDLRLAGYVHRLVQPTGQTGPLARFLSEHQPRMYSHVWKVGDLDAAQRYFEGRGMRLIPRTTTGRGFALNPEDLFGAVHEFTDQD
jgi:hypothetical protein